MSKHKSQLKEYQGNGEQNPSRVQQNSPRPAHESTLWRSIETAPKDGTTILLFGPDLLHAGGEGGFVTARWQTEWEKSLGDGIAWWKVEDGKFGPYDLRGPSPTHWMPLPQPPKPKRMSQCDNCLTIVPASELEIVSYSDGTEGDFCTRCRGGE